MRRILLILISIFVSIFFLWLAVRGVPLEDVLRYIGQSDPLWLLVCFCSVTIALWTRAIRWRGLVGFRISLSETFHIINIAFLINQLPLRVGEIARSLLATRAGVPFVTAATSIVVERLLDTLMVVLMLAVGLSNLPNVPPEVTRIASIFGVVAIFGFVILVFFARFPWIAHRMLALTRQLLPFLKYLPLEKLLKHALEGLKPLTHWKSSVHAVGWTIIGWGTSLFSFYCLHRALQITDVNLFLSSVISISMASFSIAIPMSVAAIGPFEASFKLTGQIMGMSDLASTALGFLTHGMTIFVYAIWGTIGLVRMGVSLGEIMGKSVEDTSNKDTIVG